MSPRETLRAELIDLFKQFMQLTFDDTNLLPPFALNRSSFESEAEEKVADVTAAKGGRQVTSLKKRQNNLVKDF